MGSNPEAESGPPQESRIFYLYFYDDPYVKSFGSYAYSSFGRARASPGALRAFVTSSWGLFGEWDVKSCHGTAKDLRLTICSLKTLNPEP